MKEEFARNANKWIIRGWKTLAGYIIFISALQLADTFNPNNERIKSQEQLEKVVGQEADKLGLDKSKITSIFGYHGISRVKRDVERDTLYINPSLILSTRHVVKHELYHTYKDDGLEHNLFRYLFVDEPKATAYQLFGLKL